MFPRGEAGKINMVLPVFLLGLATGIYGLMFYVPPWGRNREVVSALREAAYQGWRTDDLHLRKMVREKTDKIWVYKENGQDKPLLGDNDIDIDRTGGKVRIGVVYTVSAKIPFTDSYQELDFDDGVSASLENPFKEKVKDKGFFSFLGLDE